MRPALSESQRRVVETWGQGIAVSAGAGSGKTTTLGEKVCRLLERDPRARFAAVSFTEKSAADLREKFSSLLPSLRGHWVTTIHGMCGRILREFPREAGFDGAESVMDEVQATLLWERATEELWMRDWGGEIDAALERLLARERRSGLLGLLKRLRDLEGFGALERLASPDGGEGAASDSEALAVLGRAVLARYEALKRRRGAIDFGDLERGARRALSQERVRRFFHERFDLVLVDEFQDTNPVQAEIVWALARPDASNLCVVGDPKQSIYRFRDADVGVFEESCRRLPVRVSLSENYRSVPGVLEYANAICAPLFEASELAFEPLVPKRAPREGRAPVVRLDVRDPEGLARWLQQQVGAGVPLESHALLLKRMRGNERWLRALTRAGLPLAVSSGGFFWADPRVRELVALLRWWIDPAHELSGAVFLRAPWVNVPDPTIDDWLAGERRAKGLQRFWDSSHPIARRLKPLRERVTRPAQVLEALLEGSPREAAALEDELGVQWLALWHRTEVLSEQGLHFRGVVLELSRALEEERREREVPPPQALGQLRVLTVHGSKGLEFERVILVDLADPERGRGMPLLYWDRAAGAYLAGRDEDGGRVAPSSDPVERRWRELERSRELAESKRVFYVALTRARDQLVLVCPPRHKPVDPQRAALAEDWRAWVECGPPVTERLSAPEEAGGAARPRPASSAPPHSAPERLQASPRVLPRHSVTDWTWLGACARAFAWKVHGHGAGSAEPLLAWGEDDEGTFAGGRGALSAREVGTQVHACLASGDWEALRALAKEEAARFRAADVEAWARTSPLMRLPDEAAGRRVWNEFPFEIRLGGHTLVGAIDRLVSERDAETGRTLWSVVDFKVVASSRPDRDLLASYAAQLRLYAEAVRRIEKDPADWRGWIVEISPQGVRAVEVPELQAGERLIAQLSEEAGRWVSAATQEIARAPARPSKRCALCASLAACSDGRAYLKPPLTDARHPLRAEP